MFQPRLSLPEVMQRLERAYLAPFAGLAPPERLLEALRLARPLSFVDMAGRHLGPRPSALRPPPRLRGRVPHPPPPPPAPPDPPPGGRPPPTPPSWPRS